MNAVVRPELILTPGQQAAYDRFVQFLLDDTQKFFVLKGYSGTGKSTLVRHLVEQLPNISKTARLIHAELPFVDYVLTATTNKAADALTETTGFNGVNTIHSALGLRVVRDTMTGKTRLRATRNSGIADSLIFIDEASYVDQQLMQLIDENTPNSKVVYMGDPAQLSPVGSLDTPVFNQGWPEAELTEVVRQAAGNPIIELATRFRETVKTGEFFSFKPDGKYITWLPREEFNAAVVKEFTRNDWSYKDSKLLAWTNKRVVEYNRSIDELMRGSPLFLEGDYAICNEYLAGKHPIKTDELVQITYREPHASSYGVPGTVYTINHVRTVFVPDHIGDKTKRIMQARQDKDYAVLAGIEEYWADLRAAYACTINKSQGSTFDEVFIDLDDVARCPNGNQMARMLYVAVSRARYRVTLTGDLV